MKNLYIITGPPGVGKSTISKRIAELGNKSVLIEGILGGRTHSLAFFKIVFSFY